MTIMLPEDLVEQATRESGENLTSTIRRGLELIAAKSTYKKALFLKGKVDLKLDLMESRKDRDE